MFKKALILKINIYVLFLASMMDIIRGFMHTYRVRYAAENIAKIEPISDSLVLMGAFGISNFLTAFIYWLILLKAKHLSPYVLLLIPVSYFIGGMGIKYANVQMEAEFNGQYMMSFYLSICLFTSSLYFMGSLLSRKNHGIKHKIY